jgi:acetyltransferase-like isoleucine patch superfamily enzyme
MDVKINMFDRLVSRLLSRHELLKEQRRQEYFRRIATLAPTASVEPEGAIENILGDPHAVVIGENSYLRGRLITYGHGGKISIGKWSYIGVRSEIWSMNSIKIGDHVLISHDVNIHDGTGHSQNAGERWAHYQSIITRGHPRSWKDLPGLKSAPIVIEDDVWIGFGVIILKGVRIGKGSVVAAGSLVTHDVPPGVLYRCQVTPVIESIR